MNINKYIMNSPFKKTLREKEKNLSVIPLPNNKILVLSKFKALAND